MKRKMNFWVVGGDLRQAKLAQLLQNDGHSVHTYALEQAQIPHLEPESDLARIQFADCVILPLPVTPDGTHLNTPLSENQFLLSQFLDVLHPGQLLCAGRVDDTFSAMARERNLLLQDYFTREELAVANAVPTAEGAIQIAMEELPVTLHGARTLVIGFGRLGKLLAHRLAALGAKVSVSARKWSDLAWAEAYGYGIEQTDYLDSWLCPYNLIINTVPAPVLNRSRLSELEPNCLVIDLASKPGGVDLDAAQQLGVKVIWALSIPGKVAPETAGKAILNTIYNILREQEV